MVRRSVRLPPLLVGVALAFAILELASGWVEPYGLFHDEPYYWVGAKRLGLGYVDHPPLAPWVLAAATALLGDGRLAFGLVPALCGAATLLLAGRMAQRLGAGSFGQVLAALCLAIMPFNLVLFSFYSVNALEILLWTAATFVLMELIRTGNQRLWLAIGVIAGLALLNKHTFALLSAGIALAVFVSPLRTQLRSPWLWFGMATALLLAAPNIVWNIQHDWPSLAFYRSRPAADLPATPFQAFVLQIIGANPANVLVWVPGLVCLLFSRRLRPYRPLGVIFVMLFAVILVSGQRRADRIAGIYPVVLAAGTAFWDQWRGRGSTGVRIALIGMLLAFGVLVAPATLPLMPPQAVGAYLAALGQKPDIEAADAGQPLPLYLMGRLWSESFVRSVVEAWQSLPAAEKERTVILAPHWVFASVIQYHAREQQLPPVVAPHNAYWFWRADAAGRDVALAVAIPPEVLSRYFADTRQVGIFRCESCGIFGPDVQIVLATEPVRPLVQLLSEWRHFSIESAPSLRR